MPNVVVYTKSYCPYCEAVKRLLKSKGVQFKEADVTNDAEKLEELVRTTGHQTVPQVFINEKFIGGFDELKALDDSGELAGLLGI